MSWGRFTLTWVSFADAQRELQDSANKAPDESATHFLLGRLHRRLGNSEGAAHEFSLTEQLIAAKRPSQGSSPMGSTPPKTR
jgi:hypothetical protein